MKLKARGKPYYKTIGEGLHVGYRKGQVEGKWVARRYTGDQAYVTDTIGRADDIADADGAGVLNFWQAQERAREIGGKLVYAGPYRVRDAVAAYRKYLKSKSEAYGSGIRFEHHVLPQLGDMLVADLTSDQLREWHRALAKSLPIIPKSGNRSRKIDLKDPEQIRKRKVSANRVLTILKAALNMAFREGKVPSDAEWRRVEPFENVERARNRYLSLAECGRILNAADEDFRLLIRGALETGARYGELIRLRCSDFNPDSGTIHVRQSKTGNERHIILTEDGQQFFGQLAAGRSGAAPMFGKEWAASQQVRRMKLLCARAKVEPAIGFHGLRHSWASHAVMGGMPLAVVARNLGHVDGRMVERHYGHLAPSYIVDAVRKHAPRFGKLPSSNVRAL